MRKAFVFALSLAVVLLNVPSAMAQRPQGGIQGTATNNAKQPLPQVNVQVRGKDGQLAGTGATDAAGKFTFTGLNPGVYTVEILNTAGQVIGTVSVSVAAGAVATVTISAAAASAIAAGATTGAGLFGLGMGTTVAVVAGAITLGTVAVVATRNNASPSR